MKPTKLLLLLMSAAAWSQSPPAVKAHKVKTEQVTHKGKAAIRVTDALDPKGASDEDRIAILTTNSSFRNGTIEAEVAGAPGPGASDTARGFVGIAFRIASDVSKFECFYLRPTNGRADDQVRRNHSVQYVSFPEFPGHRLRKEFPEKYETYTDLVPDEWARVRIEVADGKARLFVNNASQPTLIVNDLKLGAGTPGAVGLWIGPGTVGHFANVRVSAQQ
jgi:hypothetical protein